MPDPSLGARIAVLATALALMASPALGADAPPAPKPDDDDQKVVCKKERPTGSRIPTRVCMTKAQWEGVRDGAEETFRARGADRNVLDNRKSNPGGG